MCIEFPLSRDPEFVAYDIPVTIMKAHRIKPALFDLFLGVVILLYTFVWYLSVQVWPTINILSFSISPFMMYTMVYNLYVVILMMTL